MTRLIKKYKNRRLYDTEISKYINIEDLERYVLEGIPFEVKDSQSNQDLTNITLLQILTESQGSTSQLLSPLMLRQLIVMINHPLHKNLMSITENFFQNLQTQMDSDYFQNISEVQKIWTQNMEQFFKSWQK